MKKNISPKTISLVFSVMVVCFLLAFYALAWTEPTIAPPGGNVDAPLNTGSDSQWKEGSLGIQGVFRTDSGTRLAALNGKVGIGTDVPTEKLTVDGSINVTAGNDVCIDGGNCLSTAGGAPGGMSCRVIRDYDPVVEADAWTGTEIIDVPPECIGALCHIVAKRYTGGNLDLVWGNNAYQESVDSIWFMEGVGGFSLGTNGDAVSGFITWNGGVFSLVDDLAGTENDPTKWTYQENSPFYAGEVMVCQ